MTDEIIDTDKHPYGGWALMKNGSNVVYNKIVASWDYELEGYWKVPIHYGVFCNQGMYYNAEDGLFYQDEEFTTIQPPWHGDY